MFGMFKGCSSIANVCRQVAMVLKDLPGGLALHSTNGNQPLTVELAPYVGLNCEAPIALYWGIPETVPHGLFLHSMTIGAFVCETHFIPDRWVRIANRFDVLVFPSTFCRDVFRRSGVTRPALVVPHGVEPEYRPTGIELPAKPFIFYNALGRAFFERKGTDVLVRAFKRAFPDEPDIELRLRVGDPEAVLSVLKEAGLTEGIPTIRVEPTQDLPTTDFASIYSEVHCTVHPTRGEGFGLIPLQSLACGTPVIAPIHSGLMDTLRPDWISPLNAVPPANPCAPGRDGYYCIEEAQLIAKLQEMVVAYSRRKADALALSAHIREQWTWPKALAPLTALVSAMLDGDCVEDIVPTLDVIPVSPGDPAS
ncbi:MAG: glycosyltransferase [Pseudomonadota bacterium]